MFGMEKNKKKKQAEKTVFDMETNLKNDPQKKKEMEERTSKRIEALKQMLREGHDDQKEFEQMTFLLHGYNSMLKVIRKI